jgi:hypothetical protein
MRVTETSGPDAATTDRTYALDVQEILAGIEPGALAAAGVTVDVTTHTDFTPFVKSKAGVDEATRTAFIHEFVTDRDADGRPTQLRVKTKSGESLNEHFGAPGAPVAAHRNVTGTDVIRTWLDRAVAASSNPDAAKIAAEIVVDGDSMAAAGQDWVPEFASVRTEDGVVHLQSRSMFIASMHPLPAGFVPPPGVLGVHYVALPAPELIEAIVDGTATL